MAGCEVQQTLDDNHGSSSDFSLSNVSKAFSECFNGEDVFLDKYIDAYNELVRFFNMMGTLFSFITSDVNSKVDILQQHLSSPDSANYATVKLMMSHEIGLGLPTTWTNKHLPSGSRTLLRLHRALAFISRLFTDLADSQQSSSAQHGEDGGDSSSSSNRSSFSTMVSRAYDATLAPYHSWLVRKGVAIALYALPSHHAMLQRMKNDGTEEQIVQKLKDAVAAMSPVYDHVQSLYIENSLQDLP